MRITGRSYGNECKPQTCFLPTGRSYGMRAKAYCDLQPTVTALQNDGKGLLRLATHSDSTAE